MSLTDFIGSKEFQEKIESELNHPFNNRIKYYHNSKHGITTLKENVGFSICGNEGKIELICDSYGKKKPISSFEDIIGFLTLRKYLDKLCWFHCSESDFDSIIQNLPKNQLKELFHTHEIEYYANKILFQKNRHIFIKIGNTNYKFFNLFPLIKNHLDAAASDILTDDRSDIFKEKILDIDIGHWNNNYEDIVKYCKNNAKYIKYLADYYIQEVKNLEFQHNFGKIVNVPMTKNYNVVGTAFDYLLRFRIKAENPTALTQQWIAYRSLYRLNDEEMEIAISILKESMDLYTNYLKSKEISDDLLKSTIYLSKLDFVYRKGFNLKEIGLDVDARDIADLRNLINGVPKGLFVAKRSCILNPSFGIASDLVGGADADLLIDNTLIDIKTTTDYRFLKPYFYQLIGYFLLQQLGHLYLNNIQKIGRIGFHNGVETREFEWTFLNTKIQDIGIYFSRFNKLFTVNINEILPEGKIDWRLLAWFEQEAHRQFRPVMINKYFEKTIESKLRLNHIALEDLLYPDA